MRPASEAFRRAVRSSHTMTARARLVPAGQVGTDPDGVETPIIDGDVKLDAGAAVRGTLDLTTSGKWPDSPTHPLAPYGQEVFVERGLRFGNGITEWVSLGYFRINALEQDDVPAGTIRLGAGDRMAGLEDARLLAPHQFTASDTVGDVFARFVGEVYPGLPIEWDDDTLPDRPLGRDLVAEQDRRGFLADLVTALAKSWRFDHRGWLVIADPPDAGAPVTRLDAGPGGVLVSVDREVSREGVYNAVVATGEAPDEGLPARAVAVDNDPASPTYFYGDFGPVPEFYSSPILTTDDQALAAASTLLRQSVGLPYAVNLEAVPDPSLEPLDVVTVAYPDRVRGGVLLEERHVLDQMTIPLTAAGALAAKTREQTTLTIGEVQ